MEQTELVKQMIQFNKTGFNNTFNAMVVLQDQTEQMILSFMESSPWVPEETKKALKQWFKTWKKGQEEYRKIVDEGFKKVDELFCKPEKKAKEGETKAK